MRKPLDCGDYFKIMPVYLQRVVHCSL